MEIFAVNQTSFSIDSEGVNFQQTAFQCLFEMSSWVWDNFLFVNVHLE